MTTYCAPCLADLALVREATTSVGGTASCMAHAVLLVHPHDDPHRRRQRLAQLRDSATEKLETVGPEERLRLEVLVEEYSLASAMDSLVPRRRPDAPRERPEGGRPGDAPLSRSARKRRARDNRERTGGPAPTPTSGPVADGGAGEAAPGDGSPPSLIGEAAPSAPTVGGSADTAPAQSETPAQSDAPASSAPPAPPAPAAAPPAEPSARPDAPPAEAAGGLAGDTPAPPAPSAASTAGGDPAPAEAAGGLASDGGAPTSPSGTVTPGPITPVAADGDEGRPASSD